MKLAFRISRILLGLIFTVFGLNGFHPFLPMPALPPGLAVQYMTVLSTSHYFLAVFALEVIGGVILLSNRYIPVALCILGPILVNILLFHSLMEPSGLPLAFIVLILWSIVFYGVRSAFATVLAPKTEVQ